MDWKPGEVRVRSVNGTGTRDRKPQPGRGLTGMRHRAELLGGSFEAGTSDGRFDVRVVIPNGSTA